MEIFLEQVRRATYDFFSVVRLIFVEKMHSRETGAFFVEREGARLLLKRIFNRLAQMFVTLLGVSFITFCLAYLAPGDPVAMLLESADTIVSEEVLQKTREELGLDKPFLVQYGNWLVIRRKNPSRKNCPKVSRELSCLRS